MYYKFKKNYDIQKILNNKNSLLNLNNKIKLQNDKEFYKNNSENNITPYNKRELELMRQLYTEINTLIYPFIVEILDEYEFIGSPLYNPIGIDRETISQMIDQIINLAEQQIDQVGEIKLKREENSIKNWDNWALLRSAIESLLLNDIFGIRRPNYFDKYAPNSLK